MPGSSFGPMQGFVDDFGRGVKTVTDLADGDAIRSALARMLGMPQIAPSGTRTPDPAWHNSMVDEANESFRKAAEHQQAQPARRMPVRSIQGR